ncbi:MAG: hypothetical protein WC028_13790 [Candidatus Obscuribacterales bacterium]
MTDRPGGFSSNPPWWFKTLSWTMPISSVIIVGCFLMTLSYCLNMLGYPLAAFIASGSLILLLFIFPVLFYIHAIAFSNWYRKNVVALICVNILLIMSLGTTQGGLSNIAWHVCGMPIHCTLKEAESCSEGMFLPNRCGKELNSRASAVLRRMYEKPLCNQVNPAFVCRLLAIDLNCAPICYRIERTSNGGELYFSRLDHEPFTAYPQKQSNSVEAGTTNKILMMSPAQMLELSKNLTRAKHFYSQNKFRTVEYSEIQKQYLLEFQVEGKHYYYSFHENNRWQYDPKPTKLEPEFIVKIREICEDVVRSK